MLQRMKRLLFLFLVVLMFSARINARPLMFADSVTVSLLTCEPGEALYARFGHTAIRVRDSVGQDVVYNYGLFDFRTENFYWKFLLGQTDYLLGVSPTDYFLKEYQERNTIVWEQVLNLNIFEKKMLIAALNRNYEPENRMYRYNFAFDNCATRPRDKIQEVVDGVLALGTAYEHETYRQLINRFLADAPWAELGINLVFGAEADKRVRNSGSDFLPMLLRDNFQRGLLVQPEKQETRKLVSEINMLVFADNSSRKPVFWLFQPEVIFILWLIPGVALSFFKKSNRRNSLIFDSVLFTITGIAGLLLFLLTFFSEHPLVGSNYNLLWLNPLNLVAAVLIWPDKTRKLMLWYHAICVFLILLYFLLVTLYVQSVPVSILPLILLLIYRNFRRVRRLFHELAIVTPKGLQWL
jgi:hypothetical protein